MKQATYIILFLFLVFIVYINNRKKLKSKDIGNTDNKYTDKIILPRPERQLENDQVFDEDYQYPEFKDKSDIKPFSIKTELSVNTNYVPGVTNMDLYNSWKDRQSAYNEKYANTSISPPVLWRPPKN